MTLAVYVGASALAGALTGAVLGVAGGHLSTSARAGTASALAIVGIVVGAFGVLGRPLRLPQCDIETPKAWIDRGGVTWGLMNGSTLGIGATTRIGFALWYAIPTAALLLGSVAFGAAVYGAYGLTRALGAAGMIFAGRGGDIHGITDWLLERAAAPMQTISSAGLLVGGVAISVGVGF
jgi:hypothetical protein